MNDAIVVSTLISPAVIAPNPMKNAVIPEPTRLNRSLVLEVGNGRAFIQRNGLRHRAPMLPLDSAQSYNVSGAKRLSPIDRKQRPNGIASRLPTKLTLSLCVF